MKIENIRYWFACNSSSTHSVVFQPGHSLTDKLCGNDDNVSGEDYFGWEPFVAASELARRTYLKGLIRHRWYDDSETGRLVADQLFPGDFPEGGLDHQAIPLIPRKYGTHEPCYAFFREMAAYVLQDGVVIHGGNDNMEGEFPPESNVNWYKAIPKDVTDDNWVCRNEGDWWVLFNQKTGTKVTLSFKDNPEPRVFASVPELVDLKITDFCPYGCQWCYQGSTHEGRHAEDASKWVDALQKMEVFEVAIGGGEPTLHPDFKSLLCGGTPDLVKNFSTRNLDWVCYNADLIRENCGSFAFSVDGEGYLKIKDLVEALDKAGLREKVTFQYVMGTSADWDFKELVKTCHEEGIRLTLLGYKTTGRGKKASKKLPRTPQQDGDGWIETIKEYGYGTAIDTALAAHVPQDVFDERYLRRKEGTHSMYIDAVTSMAGISSYTEHLVSIPNKYPLSEPITEAFWELQKVIK